jgi:putative phosphoribosyl transferase
MEKYQNRYEAGKRLADKLRLYQDRGDVLVLALPRGGVPVAYEIATGLHLPLDIYVVRKLGVPGQSELAFGAMATGGVKVFNDRIITGCGVTKDEIAAVIKKEEKELQRREIAYRGHRDFPLLHDKTIILVDDGIATGATMRAAIKALRIMKPAKLIGAVPVAEKTISNEMKNLTDEWICPLEVYDLQAVGAWYIDFSQTEDEEVYRLLNMSTAQ